MEILAWQDVKISTEVAAERADTSVDAVAVSNKMDLQKHEGGGDPSLHRLSLGVQAGKSWKGSNEAVASRL